MVETPTTPDVPQPTQPEATAAVPGGTAGTKTPESEANAAAAAGLEKDAVEPAGIDTALANLAAGTTKEPVPYDETLARDNKIIEAQLREMPDDQLFGLVSEIRGKSPYGDQALTELERRHSERQTEMSWDEKVDMYDKIGQVYLKTLTASNPQEAAALVKHLITTGDAARVEEVLTRVMKGETVKVDVLTPAVPGENPQATRDRVLAMLDPEDRKQATDIIERFRLNEPATELVSAIYKLSDLVDSLNQQLTPEQQQGLMRSILSQMASELTRQQKELQTKGADENDIKDKKVLLFLLSWFGNLLLKSLKKRLADAKR